MNAGSWVSGRARGGRARRGRTPARAALPATSLQAADYLTFADRLQVALNPHVGREGRRLPHRQHADRCASTRRCSTRTPTPRWPADTARPVRTRGPARSCRWLTQAPAFRLKRVARRRAGRRGSTGRARRSTSRSTRRWPRRWPPPTGAGPHRPAGVAAGTDPQPDRARRPLAVQPQAAPRPGELERRPVPGRRGRERPRRSPQSPYRHWLTWYPRPRAARKITRGTTNLNAGYGFHYRPDRPGAKENRNSTSEYASMVLGVVGPYDLARGEGMTSI